jgi:hypothetical protein
VPKAAKRLASRQRQVPAGACYLCGLPLSAPFNVDHVPPQRFFARSIRRTYNLAKLLTIDVHEACNEAYRLDEQYFVHALAPFARGSFAGTPIFKKVTEEYHGGKNRRLVEKVLKEFDQRPSGLILPRGKIAKRFEGTRISRIAWKIVRGLFFHHHKIIYPEHWTVSVTLTAPGEEPPGHFQTFMTVSTKTYGNYPGVFDYRFLHFPEVEQGLHYWALLLWDRIICTVVFHDIGCRCPSCAIPAPIFDQK